MEKVAFECLVLGCRYRSENKVGHPRRKGSCFLRQKGRNKAGSLQLLRVVVRPCWIPAGLDTMLKNLVIGPQTEESGKAMKGNTRTETALGNEHGCSIQRRLVRRLLVETQEATLVPNAVRGRETTAAVGRNDAQGPGQ